eukprot:TRINITY_DN1585_c0_g1_i1.p1 TRINITY_DN1585_c0_g1~~TRINITY_DN1585_c0_g1_i1.p1  ORF type:complete len:249 (-),score=54.96 TRINITY_DN1585_c0_g1_i1:575-1321(-)
MAVGMMRRWMATASSTTSSRRMNNVRQEIVMPMSRPARFGDVVEFSYVLKLDDGTVLEKVKAEEPEKIRLGTQVVHKKMEDEFVGRSPGEQFVVKLTPSDRGEKHNRRLIRALPFRYEDVKMYGLDKVNSRVHLPIDLVLDPKASKDLFGKEEAPEVLEVLVSKCKLKKEFSRGSSKLYEVTLDFNSRECDVNYYFAINFEKNHGNLEEFEGDEFEDEDDYDSEYEEHNDEVPPFISHPFGRYFRNPY